MCDVCRSESPDSRDVGVAAVPSAPVSVMWCQNCLRENAVPLFVLETWLFNEFWEDSYPEGQRPMEMPAERPDYPLAEWTTEMTVWLDGAYVPLPEAWPTLWDRERETVR